MDKNKIIKAIDEGIKTSLIAFDADDSFEKTKKAKSNIVIFKPGESVYYSSDIGFNRDGVGEDIATCVNGLPGEEMFISKIIKKNMAWMGVDYNRRIPISPDGMKNTKYVLRNFAPSTLLSTIWEGMSEYEYIPSLEEMEEIAKSGVVFLERNEPLEYWTSTQCTDGPNKGLVNYDGCAYVYNLKSGHASILHKTRGAAVIKLINLDMFKMFA